MGKMTRGLVPLASAVVLFMLAGCPSQPLLSVSPPALDFSSADTLRTVRIRNTGGGTLEWQAQTDATWLSINESSRVKQSSLSGTTTTEIDVLEINVDRSQLSLGRTSGRINITSNGGDQSVSVSVEQTSPATLEVLPLEVNLGSTSTQGTFTITNTGTETLEWSLEESAAWLTVSPIEGTLAANASAEVTVRGNRDNLPGGETTATVNITSNGGDEDVLVRINVPPFAVLPAEIDFGFLGNDDAQILTITNNRVQAATIGVTAILNEGAGWLDLDLDSVNVPAEGTGEVLVSVSPFGLAPGEYTATVNFNDAVAGYSQNVPVRIEISAFTVSTELIDFGALTAADTRTFVIGNAGDTPIAYNITVPVAAREWLSVSPDNGTVVAADTITVEVDPASVDPGNFESTLTITYEGGQQVITIRFSRPRPATLRVEPNNIDLGTTRVQELLGIWNDGIGTVKWEIDTTAFPAWLELTPVNASGIASGTVSGAATDTVTITVDRSQAPVGVFDLEHNFIVQASLDDTTAVPVTVRATVPVLPIIEVEADGADEGGIQFINFDVDDNERTFVIRNLGTGDLAWSIDLAGAPAFISSVAPQQGNLAPGASQTVTIVVDRDTLNFLGAQFTLLITSNDPTAPLVPLLVEVQVAKKIAIGARPASIPFGVNQTSATLEVANVGDPETILNFQVTPSKEWLSVFPETGRSIGTASPIKDFRAVSVSVDRSKLEGNGVSGKLTITAFEIRDGLTVPLEDVEPVEIIVSAEASELTIESPRSRTRIPSLVRTVMLMRNLRFQALPIPQTRLAEVGQQFRIFEDDEALEITETNQYLTTGSRLKTNVLVLLDYSGSMQAAARRLEEDGQIANPLGGPLDDPLQFVYEQAIPDLVLGLPDSYRIALGVFNDRAPSFEDKVRLIIETPDAPRFIKDKGRILTRLASIDVEDNGATELLPALDRATAILLEEDETFIFPFDDADVRAVVCITDGRLTTPPGNLNDTRDLMRDNFVRLLAVGWGENTAADPLLRLTQPTGGHFYSCRTEPTGAVDSFGSPIRKPLLSELLDWCQDDLIDPCDQSIMKDLQSQVVLSYATLREETSVNIEGRVTFDDPNDGPVDPRDPDSACLPDQGDISGDFSHPGLDFFEIIGDTRMGQISLNATQIVGGEATVTARLEYAPRNVRRFAFQIDNDGPGLAVMDVETVPLVDGGAISDWNLSVAGNVFTFESPDGEPLLYGDFGDLFRMSFTGVSDVFQLLFTVIEPVYDPLNPNSKYITAPDGIDVGFDYSFLGAGRDEFLAPAFPRPLIISPFESSSLDSLLYDFGTGIDAAVFGIANIGGSHVSVDGTRTVGLGWSVSDDGGDGGVVLVDPVEGFVASTLTPDPVTFSVDRSLPPGIYTEDFTITYDFGAILIELPSKPLQIRYTILPPDLSVTPDTLDFGAATIDLPLTVANLGQSSLNWEITNIDLLPAWLSTRRVGSTLGPEGRPDATATFNVTVDRTGVPPGAYSFTLVIEASNDEIALVQVQMTVP